MTQSEPPADTEEPVDPPGPDWLYRLKMRVTGDSAFRRMVWRVIATTFGVLIVLVGISMLVLPGPGWAVIFLGLAVLATEYAWAHRLLVVSKQKAQGAASSVWAPENRKRNIALGLSVFFLAAALVSWYVHHYGWTMSGGLGWFGIS